MPIRARSLPEAVSQRRILPLASPEAMTMNFPVRSGACRSLAQVEAFFVSIEGEVTALHLELGEDEVEFAFADTQRDQIFVVATVGDIFDGIVDRGEFSQEESVKAG